MIYRYNITTMTTTITNAGGGRKRGWGWGGDHRSLALIVFSIFTSYFMKRPTNSVDINVQCENYDP